MSLSRTFASRRRPATVAIVVAFLGAAACQGDGPTDPSTRDPVAVTLAAMGWPDTVVAGSHFAVRIVGVTATGDTARGVPAEAASLDTAIAVASRVAGTDSVRLQVRRPGRVGLRLRIPAGPIYAATDAERQATAIVGGLRIRHADVAPVVTLAAYGDSIEVFADGVGDQGAVRPPRVRWTLVDPAGAFAPVDTTAESGESLILSARQDGAATLIATATEFCRGQCVDTLSLVVAQQAATMRVSPRTALLSSLGDSLVPTVQVHDRRGNALTSLYTAGYVALADTTIVRFTTANAIRAAGNGTARIWFRAAGIQDTLQVTVRQAVASLRIDPRALIAVERSAAADTLSATLLDARGVRVARVVPLSWGASPEALLVVEPLDSVRVRVRGGGLGVGYLRVRADSLNDSIPIQVVSRIGDVRIVPPANPVLTAIGDTVALHADVLDGAARVDSTAQPEWVALDSATVQVDALGRAWARAPGTGRVAARVNDGAQADTVTLTVAQVAAWVNVPPAYAMTVGDSILVSASAMDRRGVRIDSPTVSWSVVGTPAVVRPSGHLVALTPGVTTLRATVDAALGSSRVAVVANPIVAKADADTTLPISITLPPNVGLSPVVNFGGGSADVVWWSSEAPTQTIQWQLPRRTEGRFTLRAAATVVGQSESDSDPTLVAYTAYVGQAADSIEIVSGDGQTAPVSTVPADSIVIRTPMPYTQVTLRVVAGGGYIEGTTAVDRVTDAGGRLTVRDWMLGPSPQANTLRVSGGTASPKDVTATGVYPAARSAVRR